MLSDWNGLSHTYTCWQWCGFFFLLFSQARLSSRVPPPPPKHIYLSGPPLSELVHRLVREELQKSSWSYRGHDQSRRVVTHFLSIIAELPLIHPMPPRGPKSQNRESARCTDLNTALNRSGEHRSVCYAHFIIQKIIHFKKRKKYIFLMCWNDCIKLGFKAIFILDVLTTSDWKAKDCLPFIRKHRWLKRAQLLLRIITKRFKRLAKIKECLIIITNEFILEF